MLGKVQMSSSTKGEQLMTVKFAIDTNVPIAANNLNLYGSCITSFFDSLLANEFYKRFNEWSNYRVNSVDIQVWTSLNLVTSSLDAPAPTADYLQMTRVAIFEDSTSPTSPSADGITIVALPQAKVLVPAVYENTGAGSVPTGGLAPVNDRIAKFKWVAKTVNAKMFSSFGSLPINTYLGVLGACYTTALGPVAPVVDVGFMHVRYLPSVTFKGYYPGTL
jgi:hypothetical protein